MSKRLFEQTIMQLLNSGKSAKYPGKRFYGHLINKMRRVYTKRIPTMAVSVTDQINLYINPDFFVTLEEQQRVEVLEHECKHLANYHLDRIKGCADNDHHLWNIACDACINEPLTSLHEFGVTVDKLNEMFGLKLQANDTAENHYRALRDYRNKNQKQNDKLKELSENGPDTHETWDESGEGEEGKGTGNNRELQKEILKKAMKKAVQDCNGAGNIPSEMLRAIEKLNKSTVNWKQQMRRFFTRAHRFNKESTRQKLNRRYRHLQPGKRKKPSVHIAVGVDESGSINDKAHTQFFSEIDTAARLDGIKFTIIHCDCEVNKVYEYVPGMKIERTGCGGTEYSPAINKAIELGVNGMIYFGDGDIFGEIVKKPNFPLLWAMENDRKPPVDWGSVVNVKVDTEY
jgi:predicted metal-dependent peptidase